MSALVGANSSRLRTLFFLSSAECGAVFSQALTNINQQNISVGKYLVSPLIKDLDDGRFSASVSIRSGQGKGTHDRVMRLTPHFGNRAAAVRYAIEQGLGFVRERTSPRHSSAACPA